MAGPAWRLQLVGALQLVHSDHGPLALSRKDAALLALIALAGPLPTARAAALLWPEATTAAGAVNNLRQRLHRLRRDTAARLVESADSLALAPDLRGPQPPTREALAADPGAWDGELLGAHDYDDHPDFAAWLQQQREAWRTRRTEALAALADEAEQQADWPRALRHAQRLLQEEPLAEHAHCRLMRLHYLRGDRAAAVAAFELCEQRLKDELSLKPSAETLALLAQVERLAPLQLPARSIPPALSRPPRMVGRGAEIAALAAAAASHQVALVLGEAGLGKTRLLEELLAQRPGLVYARARPGDAGVPWAVLTRLLRELLKRHGRSAGPAQRPLLARLLPELGSAAAGEGEAQRALLLRAIEQWLAAAGKEGLDGLVVDDLHFADRASLEGLRALVDAEPPLAWLLAQRPDELATGTGPALQPLLEPLRVHARSVLALAWTHLAQPARVHQALAGDLLPEGLPPTVLALRLLLLRGGLVAPEDVDDSRLPALQAAVQSLGNGLVGGLLQLALARQAGWGDLLDAARRLALSREASLPPLSGLARVAWAEALATTGQHAAGREQVAQALQAVRGLSYMAVYKPQLWWRLRAAALALDAPALAAQAQADALHWLGEVLPALPEAWCPAFVERNLVNRALLAAARA